MNQSHRVGNTLEEFRLLGSASLAGDDVPSRLLLAPWGHVESTNGTFVVDEESARHAVAAFAEHGTDLPIDYEHQTLGGEFASPSGQAPAAGWIKNLAGEPGVGLMAEIEWTPQGRSMIASKQYRYLSPVAVVRKADRKLVGIHSAALTNKPAIVGMRPIVNGRRVPVQNASDSPLESLRGELGLPDDSLAEEILIAAGQRLALLRAEARQQQAQMRIRDALRSGKLVEAQRAWAEEVLRRDEALFEEWMRSAPVVVTPGVTAGPMSAAPDRHRDVVAARARSEYRGNRLLAALTSEAAYVEDAVRNDEWQMQNAE